MVPAGGPDQLTAFLLQNEHHPSGRPWPWPPLNSVSIVPVTGLPYKVRDLLLLTNPFNTEKNVKPLLGESQTDPAYTESPETDITSGHPGAATQDELWGTEAIV